MATELGACLHGLDRLQVRLQPPATQRPDPLQDLAKDAAKEVAVHVAGELARDFLGKRGPGKRLARKQIRNGAAQAKKRSEADARERYLQVLAEAESLVEANTSLLPRQNLVPLRRTAAEARTAAKSATIARRTHDYIERARVAIRGAMEIPPPSALLQNLEREIRTLITRELSEAPHWWSQRIPADVRQHAEARAAGRSPLIDYVDFPDYQKILLQKNNWEEYFKRSFGNREWLQLRLTELALLRNDIAHSRSLSHEDAMRFRILARDLTDRIGAQ